MSGRLTKWGMILTLVSLVTLLSACGGGGGGGGAAPIILGTVTDSNQMPVAGATVQLVDTTGVLGSATTDAAGRYSIAAPASGTPFNLVATGFNGVQTGAEGLASAGVSTVVDLYLPVDETGSAVTLPSAAVNSSTTIGSARPSSVDTSAFTANTGAAVIYQTPVDVTRMEGSIAPPPLAPLAAGPGEILELFAAGGFDIEAAGVPIAFGTDIADFYLPVHNSSAAAAPAATDVGVFLQYFDTATGDWVDDAAAFVLGTDPTASFPAYVVSADKAGFWRVGQAVAATTISGIVRYADATPAAGVTVYVNGANYGYQQVAVTDTTGAYSVKAKTGGSTNLSYVAWGGTAQFSDSATVTATGTTQTNNVNLPFDPPGATVTLVLDDVTQPSFGFNFASGKLVDGTSDTAANTSDIFITASIFALDRLSISVNNTPSRGWTLNGTPAGSTVLADGNISSPATVQVTLPYTATVVTPDGHTGVLTITGITPSATNVGQYTVTFTSSFRL